MVKKLRDLKRQEAQRRAVSLGPPVATAAARGAGQRRSGQC